MSELLRRVAAWLRFPYATCAHCWREAVYATWPAGAIGEPTFTCQRHRPEPRG